MTWLVGLALLWPATWAVAEAYRPDWSGQRRWVGPDAWARPMQHWSVNDHTLRAVPTVGGSMHLMACEIGSTGDLSLRMQLQRLHRGGDEGDCRVGFWLGTRGAVDDWRSRAVYAEGGLRVGLDHRGRVFIGDTLGDDAVPLDGPVTLEVGYDPEAGRLEVTAQPVGGAGAVTRSALVAAERLAGGLAVLAETAHRTDASADDATRWAFGDLRLEGSALSVHGDRVFGPVLWTQYTLSDGVLKLSAQMPPMGDDDPAQVSLWLQRGNAWSHVGDAPIDPDARTAVFRVTGWSESAAVGYRVVYRWRGRDHAWSGRVRAEPTDAAELNLAAFSCDHGYAFPQPRLVADVARRDPDLLFFAGDQIYERFGLHGIQRRPIEVATLDYLRKFYLFGWTWRHLLADRPSVILPDDHDVFQGNLYGMGGRATPPGEDFDYGGYVMAPRWVNMVQRTQTGHLPDPADPSPLPSGIATTYTALRYGGLRWAILEDRKFKTGRNYARQRHRLERPWQEMTPQQLDLPDTQLLGPAQLAFLTDWARAGDHEAIHVVLTQTMFASVQTHSGPGLKYNAGFDLDTNGWPRAGRDAALRAMMPARPVILCGDQHLGALVRHGIESHDDGPLQFMVTGTANGWPRAFWPDTPRDNPAALGPDASSETGSPSAGAADRGLGPYTDPFGNRVTVLGLANPQPRRQEPDTADPETRATLKASGYGWVRFDKQRRRATFDLLRYPPAPAPASVESGDVADGGSFPGFPITLELGPAN